MAAPAGGEYIYIYIYVYIYTFIYIYIHIHIYIWVTLAEAAIPGSLGAVLAAHAVISLFAYTCSQTHVRMHRVRLVHALTCYIQMNVHSISLSYPHTHANTHARTH